MMHRVKQNVASNMSVDMENVQGLERPRAAVPVVGFYPRCRYAFSTSTPLGVHQPTARAVLPAVHDRTEGVPDRWHSCLE